MVLQRQHLLQPLQLLRQLLHHLRHLQLRQ
jgi:hypothetical protein